MQILIRFHLLYSLRCLIVSKSRSINEREGIKWSQAHAIYISLPFSPFFLFPLSRWINFSLSRNTKILNFLFLYAAFCVSKSRQQLRGWNEKYVTQGRFVINKGIYTNDGWHRVKCVGRRWSCLFGRKYLNVLKIILFKMVKQYCPKVGDFLFLFIYNPIKFLGCFKTLKSLP